METVQKNTLRAVLNLLDNATLTRIGNAVISLASLSFWNGRPAANEHRYAGSPPKLAQSKLGPVPKKEQEPPKFSHFFAFRAKSAPEVKSARKPRRYWASVVFADCWLGVKMLTSPQ